MPYSVEYDPEAARHLRAFEKRVQVMVADAITKHLRHNPLLPTRNRKQLRPNWLATWELRVGDVRVYYDVPASQTRVRIVAIGRKIGNQVLIENKVVQL